MTCWGVVVTLVLYFFGYSLVALFFREAHLRELGAAYLRVLAVCQITGSLEGVASGILRGMGKTVPPSIISIVSNGIRVPLAFILSLTGLGLYGIWIAISAGAVLRGFGMCVWCLLDARKRPKNDVVLQANVNNL